MMISLERTDAEIAEKKSEYAEGGDMPKYPWGLEIRLEDEELEKLKLGMMPVGTEVTFIAKAAVTAVRENETEDGKDRCLTLQIRSMEFPGRDNSDEIAEKMYGSEE